MQTPYRKPGKYSGDVPDPNMTAAKYQELQIKLAKLKKAQPAASAEVKRLALMGDFSENAAYQIAKGRLRGLNQRILDIEKHLKNAQIIEKPTDNSRVSIGHRVKISSNGKEKEYLILGSSETNPDQGIISHNSPLGRQLLGKRVGDEIILDLNGQQKTIKVIEIK